MQYIESIFWIAVHPFVFTTILILMVATMYIAQRFVRSKKHKNSTIKKYASLFVFMACVFLLLVFVFQTVANALTYITGVRRLTGLSEKYYPVFNTIFDHAKRCSSSGSIDEECSRDHIQNLISGVAGTPPKSDRTKLFVEPQLARVAVDERVELLDLNTGEFFSRDTTSDDGLAQLRSNIISGESFLSGSNWKGYFFRSTTNDNWWEKKWSHELIYHPNGKVIGAFTYTEWYEEDDFLLNGPIVVYISPFILFESLNGQLYGSLDLLSVQVTSVVWVSFICAIILTWRLTRAPLRGQC
jgi:hypothetical protein